MFTLFIVTVAAIVVALSLFSELNQPQNLPRVPRPISKAERMLQVSLVVMFCLVLLVAFR
jgi:hypothetical protein